MKNHITDEKTVIGCTLQGDCYLPIFYYPPQKNSLSGFGGAGRQRHLRYIRQHKRLICTNLLTICKLNSHLADIDRQARPDG